MWAIVLLVLVTAVLTACLVGLVWRFAPRLKLVQTANSRSSHRGARPTGGGIGIAGAILIVALWLTATGISTLYLPVLIGFGLALVGLADDRGGLPVPLRLLAQAAAMIGLFAAAPELAGIFVPAIPVWLALPLLALCGLIWINLFNFMDGIDGLAGSETLFLCAGLLLAVATIAALPEGQEVLAFCLAVAALTFVAGFNWQPARIFMGDGGAYFVSFVTFYLALHACAHAGLDPAAALILPGLFLADAGVTLIRRIAGGKHIFDAHRTHAYQHLSDRFGHAGTVLMLMAINLVWVLPFALLVQTGWINRWLGLGLAYLMLLVFVVIAKAGRPLNAR